MDEIKKSKYLPRFSRLNIINILINKIKARSYLEIGLGDGIVFKRVKCKNKTGVDPCLSSYKLGQKCTYEPTYKMTSDEFFKINKKKFDIIFIDGLHESKQVEKDIKNSLRFLNKNGYIICHDINPPNIEAQKMPRKTRIWTGDCWKAWVKIRTEHKNLKMFTVNTDYGCGIIQVGPQESLNLKGKEINYQNLTMNRKKWLNLIGVKKFKEQYK